MICERNLECFLPLAEVENQLQKHFATQAKFGPHCSVKNISGGFSGSFVAILQPDWTIPDATMPQKIFVKVTSVGENRAKAIEDRDEEDNDDEDEEETEAELLENDNQLRKYFRTELRMLQHFRDNPIPEFAFLPLLAHNDMEKETNDVGYMCVPYIDGCEKLELFPTLPQTVIVEALRQIAKLQAHQLTSDLRGFLKHRPISMDFFSPNVRKRARDTFSGIASNNDLFDLREQLLVVMDQIDDDYVQFFIDDAYRIGMRDVLCHADLYPGNTLYSTNPPRFIAIIDYQDTAISHGAVDIIAYITLAYPVSEERRTHEIPLLHKFHEFLCAEFDDSSKVPYTLEQLIENYKRFFAVLNSAWLLWLVRKADDFPECRDPTKRQVMQNWRRGLAVDCIHYHQRNMEIIHNSQKVSFSEGTFE